ncbi:SDR family NAD(P)-dependent oxidoreductase [Thermanaeromonas sp. C210]|uniref:SDR family NAD(P)-dependent oxidoreductase n=1 Tax=Thermanaeromonas sp. C210 TaxID=2731925 RepID=UPI00155CE47B|nr:3-oxoacyl-ACP reductase family protein [Thermanaeromonas sp. C210]GFN24221.1 oxidoreductase [Thermanaeromonas sp. C210]
MYNFQGKVVWVTGSSTGIGRAIARGFARHGADVIVHYRNSAAEAFSLVQEMENMGRRALLVKGDVSCGQDVEEMVREIQESFGRLDILVNNAGSMIKRARLEEADEELWESVMNTNLKSAFMVTKAVLPMMKAQGRGKIINITSVAVKTGGGPGALIYATAKGALATFTRGLAKELAGDNILVNAVAPGLIRTPFHKPEITPPEMFEDMARNIPLKRAGVPEDVVGAVLFLASDYADYITGQTIDVNGGMVVY